MTCALINGLVGLALSLLIGMGVLEFPFGEVIFIVLISNIAGLVSLLVTLRAEKSPWLKETWLNHFLKTWLFLAIQYFGILLGFCSSLRSPGSMLLLVFPLILSTGFGIIIFGPIQDIIVKRSQKKASPSAPALEMNEYFSPKDIHY